MSIRNEGLRNAWVGAMSAGAMLLCCMSCTRQGKPVEVQEGLEAATVTKPPPEMVQDPTPPGPDASVFVLQYRGIGADETDLWSGSASGWGSTYAGESPFFEQLKEKFDVRPVYNPSLKDRMWSGLEMDGDNVVALHIDLDRDGKPGAEERLLPVTLPENDYRSRGDAVYFLTPDMDVTDKSGREMPARMVIRAEGGKNAHTMWSSASYWTGRGEVDGVPYELMLRGGGDVCGGFREYGRASYALRTESEEGRRWRRWRQLSRIISLDDQFMRLRFLGDESHADDFRLILEPYEGAIGSLRPKAVAQDDREMAAMITSLNARGEDDPGVGFSLSVKDEAIQLPVGRYTITYGGVKYGETSSNLTWACRVDDYKGVVVGENEQRELPLGPPSLKVVAIDANRRYSSDVKPATEFPGDMTVYLSPEITGPHGERFGSFAQRKKPVKPTLRITDSDGAVVHSSTMEYG